MGGGARCSLRRACTAAAAAGGDGHPMDGVSAAAPLDVPVHYTDVAARIPMHIQLLCITPLLLLLLLLALFASDAPSARCTVLRTECHL